MMAEIIEPDAPQPLITQEEIQQAGTFSPKFWLGIAAAGLIVFGLPLAAWLTERNGSDRRRSTLNV